MFFASNLKFLRKRHRSSQQALADEIEIKRSAFNSYERGVQPPFEVQIKLADRFNVSLDALVRYDLRVLSEFQLSQIEQGFDVDVTGQKLRLLTVTVDKEDQENIELVPTKAQAGYTAGLYDPEFIASLPRFRLPFLPRGKTCRCFQISGDSMPPVQDGDWVTASYLQDWTAISNGQPCIIVTREEGIVFKLAYNRLAANRTLLLVSTNRNYKPYELPVSAIREIWKFETYNGFEGVF